ncbi:MAG TPA: hypothetical protein PKE39_07620 [Ignavibacteria bacterium]|nr:hypothetical protein [Ignavibacteria bacterium]HMQ98879.1 hypothetical protein [Ignavibacteria bacterium]
MFGFGKKIEKDPKKALENADKAINSGVSGFLTKTFMGQDFVDQTNASLNMAKNYTDTSNLSQTGMGGTADVLSIEDTGALINYNPVVRMKLRITPQFGPAFETTAETAVSKIAIPRVGDKINIKYNPANTSQVLVV